MSSARVQSWPFRETPSTDVIGDLWRLIKLNGGTKPSLQDSGQPGTRESFPTVLIAAENPEMRQSLTNHLRRDPCNVLQADSPARLWHAIVNHSRPIHVLLLEMDLEGPDFVEMARQYRPAMQILLVAKHSDQSQPGALPVGAAVAQARELLKSQK
jgi:CheY-like chemotaxis protein